MNNLLKSKTFWTGVSAIVGAGASYASGQVDAIQAAQLAITGALGVFLRMGIAKLQTQAGKNGAADQTAP